MNLEMEYKQSAFQGIIGVAETDITPPEGIYMGNWGAAISPVSTGTHRPLLMTCLTFQSKQSDEPMVLIGLDLGWWKDSSDEMIIRQAILHQTGIGAQNLLMCLSHTHSGPSLSRRDADKPGGHLVNPYLDDLVKKAVRLIDSALKGAEESVLMWEYGHCNLAQNRDLRDPENDRFLVGFNPDKKGDDTLLCGLVSDIQGRPRAIIVNYACHPTTLGWGNTLISPDFPGVMKEVVSQEMNVPVLYIQGASGDLAPRINYSSDLKVPEKYGKQLGFAVLSTLESITTPGHRLSFQGSVESGAPLAIWKEEEFNMPGSIRASQYLISYRIKDIPTYQELEDQWEYCSDSVEKERLWRKMGIRKALGDGAEAEISLWIWKLGTAFIVAQPNEAYSELQMDVRVMFPDRAIVVGNLVNGSYGYLAPKEFRDQNIYTVWQSPFEIGSLDVLKETIIQSIVKQEETP